MTKSQLDQSPIVRNDPGQVGASLDFLSDQLKDGWRQSKSVRLPRTYRQIDRIAVCGMGGSHLAADILRSVYAPTIRVPVTIVADYSLPGWVNRRTLVICSSYSGTTEETLAAYRSARKRGAKIVIVATGGPLLAAGERDGFPVYHLYPTANPSGQPRLGLGYGVMALIACWRSLGLISVPVTELQEAMAAAMTARRRYGPRHPAESNMAKQLALAWQNSMPLLIGAEWTAGNLHAWSNQINENAKTFAAWYQVPDLNHHLLEGMRHRRLTKQFHAAVIHDQTYQPRNSQRLRLTEKILKEQGVNSTRLHSSGKSTLAKAVTLLAFGGYVSWYLAAARKIKPAPIPTVDWLKKQLGK